MRIGILADIHGHVENLAKVITRLRREQVDEFVVLGDVIYDRRQATETVALLKDCGASGVWGNHDLALCLEPDDEIRRLFSPSVIDYFATLTSHYEVGPCLFSHTLPHQDAGDPTSYYTAPRPHQEGALDECFARFPQRILLCGHFHRWLAATPAGRLAWKGEEPLNLDPGGRCFVVIHAVMQGHAAILDDQRNVLLPIRV